MNNIKNMYTGMDGKLHYYDDNEEYRYEIKDEIVHSKCNPPDDCSKIIYPWCEDCGSKIKE